MKHELLILKLFRKFADKRSSGVTDIAYFYAAFYFCWSDFKL
jgi:hypothetical protein